MTKKRNILIIGFALLLSACSSVNTTERLQQAKDNFKQKNYTEAFKETKPLAERGDPKAQYALGYMYLFGKGVTKDKAAAKKWIEKSAAQGDKKAIKAMEYFKPKPPVVKAIPLSEEPPIQSDKAASETAD
jgi:TPR repeat protein